MMVQFLTGECIDKTSTPQRELEKLEKLRIRVITWKDKTYPPLLREIDDSPPVLYTYGKLTESDQFALAVVGTRNSTTYGRQVTERIVTDLAKGQVTIVSGLALGIDTIAHTTALTSQGRIVALGRNSLFFRTPSLHATESYRNHVHRRDRYHK